MKAVTQIILRVGICTIYFFIATSAYAENQPYTYENMSASTNLLLSQNLSYNSTLLFSEEEKALMLNSDFLSPTTNITESIRTEILSTAFYEAKRAGLDPLLILAIIEVESGFKKYAISPVGARGLMQIMPFWTDTIGTESHNLFNIQTNIRYGCVILRHYLNMEDGNLTRALARYNGALRQKNYAYYPDAIFSAYKKWHNKSTKLQEGMLYAQKN